MSKDDWKKIKDEICLLEECGRYAVPEPIADIVAVAAPLLAELGGPVASKYIHATMLVLMWVAAAKLIRTC